ncbi:GTPase-activating protein [Podochytrium sp. JEL0797]|nr:GTPase-activating protein [Podochytrium sp. JEL0797]
MEPTQVVFHADGSTSLDDGSDEAAAYILGRIEATAAPAAAAAAAPPSDKRFGSFVLDRLGFSRSASFKDAAQETPLDAAALEDTDAVDWEFWGKAMNAYAAVARAQPRLLANKLQQGIPDAIRGPMWLAISQAKSEEMEATYRALLTRSSSHEKIIQRDLARTFPSHPHFKDPNGPGQESLFNVLKAYSLYDPEVGYCQGIAFITGPLLLNMPEEEAFCVLEKLMKHYNFRPLYTPTMLGLQLRLFQYDHLLQERLPTLHAHLAQHDVTSSMYASPWFLTLFAYRFPLEIVLRIMDVVFSQGIETVFQFAFALLQKNSDRLLTLTDLGEILEFLKVGLFDAYEDAVDVLLRDAAGVRIKKSRLDKLAVLHQEKLAREHPELLEGDALKAENRRLAASLRKLEHAYEELNREHIEVVKKEMVSQFERERAVQRAEENRVLVEGLQGVLSAERREAEESVKDEMERLAHKNLDLTEQNGELEDRVDQLTGQLEQQSRRVELLEGLVKALRGE